MNMECSGRFYLLTLTLYVIIELAIGIKVVPIKQNVFVGTMSILMDKIHTIVENVTVELLNDEDHLQKAICCTTINPKPLPQYCVRYSSITAMVLCKPTVLCRAILEVRTVFHAGSIKDLLATIEGLMQDNPGSSDPIGRTDSTPRSLSNPFDLSNNGTVKKIPLPPLKRFTNTTASSATAELKRNPALSTSYDCARDCKENEASRICYYHFTLELYNVMGTACQLCTPNATNSLQPHCQCVLADGIERGFLSANRMLPGPSIQVCENDKVVVDVENHIQGMEVTIHWHGIWQRGTQYYDGAPFVTQCPIQQGTTFRYIWQANAGTHYWHAHTGLQKFDGLYGSIVVRQPPSKDPNSHRYDYDMTTHVIMISDWSHEDVTQKYPGRVQVKFEQDPENILINGKGQFTDAATGNKTNTPLEVFNVTHGKRYRFRMINAFASACPVELTIEEHDLTVIATDGEPALPQKVNTIISYSGERYDFVIEANNVPKSYWIQVRALGICDIVRTQQLGYLNYDNNISIRSSSIPPTFYRSLPHISVLNPLDLKCNETRKNAICFSQLKLARAVEPALLQKPDIKLYLPVGVSYYKPEELYQPNTYNNFFVTPQGEHVISLVDGISYKAPPAPLLSQYDDINPDLFCNRDNKPPNCEKNCVCTHKVDIPLNAIVEITLIDGAHIENFSHPFHLHGHPFHVIGVGRSPDPKVKKISLKHVLDLEKRGLLLRHLRSTSSISVKDTIPVLYNGYVIIRFRANNPGFWLLHCHFLFHLVTGMNLVLQVGNKTDFPKVPLNFPKCGNYLPPIPNSTYFTPY